MEARRAGSGRRDPRASCANGSSATRTADAVHVRRLPPHAGAGASSGRALETLGGAACAGCSCWKCPTAVVIERLDRAADLPAVRRGLPRPQHPARGGGRVRRAAAASCTSARTTARRRSATASRCIERQTEPPDRATTRAGRAGRRRRADRPARGDRGADPGAAERAPERMITDQDRRRTWSGCAPAAGSRRRVLDDVAAAVRPGVTTGGTGCVRARSGCAAEGAKSAFLGYRGFPGHICISVNEEVVHGIPGPRTIQHGRHRQPGRGRGGATGSSATTRRR